MCFRIKVESLLPGTEVQARGLRWEVVFPQPLGVQTLYRLRGLDGLAQYYAARTLRGPDCIGARGRRTL
jgi:hypothetical protein